MHFITGGAFNGKRKWVKRIYPEAEWFSAYNKELLIRDLDVSRNSGVILEGVELWVKELSEEMTINHARKYINDLIADWHNWEKADPERQLIIIGTDITKGIVPIDKADRNWRDLTGWVYQDITSRSDRADLIWCGLNQTIKDERK